MKVKQLEADNQLFISYWNFENKQLINQLFSESAQH